MDRGRETTIENHVAATRERRGLSASALAKLVGVSRQAIYAIEAGTYVPNTVLGLRLARALEVSVEELFRLKTDSRPVSATLIGGEGVSRGQPVQLCRMGERLIAAAAMPMGSYLPASDAVVMGAERAGRVRLRLHAEGSEFQNRLLVAGCDPAMGILGNYARKAGIELVLVHQNSSRSLELLKKSCVHIAGTHLREAATGESNVAAVRRLFGRSAVAVISFAIWQEGLITAGGNPKNIRGVEDLARRDVTLINREPGSGSRLLLDDQMAGLKLNTKRVRGYERFAPGHIAAAWEVKKGSADCCVATEAAARLFDLAFVPLATARYDLVLRRQDLESAAVEKLFDTISQAAFRRELNGVGGYDTAVTGERVI